MKWETMKLKEIIEKPVSGEWGDMEGNTSILRTTNFRNDGTLNFDNVVKRNISEKKIREKALKPGDCIIEKSGGSPSQPVGRVVYFNVSDELFLCNNFTSAIRPKPIAFPKYLFWFLFHNHQNGNTLSFQNKTTGIINLQLERYISELNIPLPPLATQKRIAEILDKADALRQKDQALLRKYDELAQAVFISMFGNLVNNEKKLKISRLEDCCTGKDDIKCGPFGTQLHKEDFQSKGVPLWGIKDVNKHFALKPKEFLENRKYKELEQYNIIKGDLVMTRKGTVGNCSVYMFDEIGIMHSDLLRIRVNRNICSPTFLSFQLMFSEYIKNQISQISQGAIMAGVNVSKLKSLNVHLPSIDSQIKFEKVVDNLKTQQSYLTIGNAVSLFQSLLQKAFTGELVK